MYDDYEENKGKRNTVLLFAVAIGLGLVLLIMADYKKSNSKTDVTADVNQTAGFQAIIETPTYDIHHNEDENFIRLIYSEVGNQSNSLNLAVASVVRNRVNSPDFPNTINEVIFQDSQFQSVYTGTIADYDSIPLEEILSIGRCVIASKKYDETNGAMFYYKLSEKTDEENKWILENFEHTIIDGYCFLKVFPYE